MRHLNPFGFVLAFVAVVVLGAAVLIAGLLAIAAMLPRGHPTADRLREFAGKVPRLALRSLLVFDVGSALAIGAVFVVLALVFA